MKIKIKKGTTILEACKAIQLLDLEKYKTIIVVQDIESWSSESSPEVAEAQKHFTHLLGYYPIEYAEGK